MDPTEVYERFDELAAEFPNISQLIPLPYKTNGYQRKAQALMSGTRASDDDVNDPPNNEESPAELLEQSQAVVLTSRAWGHEGGNDITAEFIHPGQLSSPLTVTMTGNDLLVRLGTDATGALASTAAQVVAAINANAAGERQARGGDLPRQRGRRDRAAAREGQPVRLPRHRDERPRPARAVPVLGACGSARSATARRSASSCTASSTPASGPRR